MSPSDRVVVDNFGFELPDLTPEQVRARRACADEASKREAKAEWAAIDRDRTSMPTPSELKKLARKGIPPHLRPWVWSHASGALARREEHGHDYYRSMVQMGEEHTAVANGNGECSPAASAKSAVGRQVDLDLPRTFPGNRRVELCLPALRRVLLAFAAHAPEVGYCQSMNFIAALLLVATVLADDGWLGEGDGADGGEEGRQQNGGGPDRNSSSRRRPFPQPARAPYKREEETAFWLLVALADDSPPPSSSSSASVPTAATTTATMAKKPRGGAGGGGIGSSSSSRASTSTAAPSPFSPGGGGSILPPGMYGRDLRGCRVELGALARLLRPRQPRLAAHVLDSLRCDASLLATEWFLCLFATSLPAETAARLWDALFVEGGKVLHRAALALLRRHSRALLAAASAGAAMRAARDGAAGEHDADGLLSTCFGGIGSLPMAKVEQARREAGREVEREVAGRAARRAGSRIVVAGK